MIESLRDKANQVYTMLGSARAESEFLPFKGRLGGDGFGVVLTHPHPILPLEGEGVLFGVQYAWRGPWILPLRPFVYASFNDMAPSAPGAIVI